MESDPTEVKVSVRCGGVTHVVNTPPAPTVNISRTAKISDLQAALEPMTGVLARKQKLISRGKVLGSSQTLVDAGLAKGGKLMLMAGAGGPTQGQAAAQEAVKQKLQASHQRTDELKQRAATLSGASKLTSDSSLQARARGWAKSGIISQLNEGLTTVPASVWEVADNARVLELSGNRLTLLPAPMLALLPGLRTLRLAHNDLPAEGVPWATLAGLARLTSLVLDHNPLLSLPEELGSLLQLQSLSLAHCRLQVLPACVGQLTQLCHLDVSHNRLGALPDAVGDCTRLEELILDSNEMKELPESLCALLNLQRLSACNNRISRVPPRILRECISLSTLLLQDNAVTAEQLREMEGFSEYNERRLAKCNKQIDMEVTAVARSFNEGADSVEWQHH